MISTWAGVFLAVGIPICLLFASYSLAIDFPANLRVSAEVNFPPQARTTQEHRLITSAHVLTTRITQLCLAIAPRNNKAAKKEDEKSKSKWINPIRQYSDGESDAEYSVYSEESSSEENAEEEEEESEEEESEEEYSSDDDYHSLSAESMKKANSTGLPFIGGRKKKDKKSYSTTQPTGFNPTRGMFGRKKDKKEQEAAPVSPRKLKTDKAKLGKNKNPFGPPRKSESLLKMEAKRNKKDKKEKDKKERAPGIPGMFGLKKKEHYEDREYVVELPKEKKSKKKSKKEKKAKKAAAAAAAAAAEEEAKNTDANGEFVMGMPAYLADEQKKEDEQMRQIMEMQKEEAERMQNFREIQSYQEVAVATPVNMADAVHTPAMQNTASMADYQMETPVTQNRATADNDDAIVDTQVQTPAESENKETAPAAAAVSSSTVDVPGALPAGSKAAPATKEATQTLAPAPAQAPAPVQQHEEVYSESYTTQAPRPVSNYANANAQTYGQTYSEAQTQPSARSASAQSRYVNESCGPDESMTDSYSDERYSPLMSQSAEMRYMERLPTIQQDAEIRFMERLATQQQNAEIRFMERLATHQQNAEMRYMQRLATQQENAEMSFMNRLPTIQQEGDEQAYMNRMATRQQTYYGVASGQTAMGGDGYNSGYGSSYRQSSYGAPGMSRPAVPQRSANRASSAAAIIPPPATYSMVVASSNKANPRNLPAVNSDSQALAKLKAKGVKKMAPAKPTKRALAEAKRKEKAKASRAKARAKAKAKLEKRNAEFMANYNNRDDDSVPRSYRKSRLSVSGMFGRSGSSSNTTPAQATIDESSDEEPEEDAGEKKDRMKKSIIASFS